MAVKKRLAKFGSQFLFNWTIRMMQDTLIKNLIDFLKPIKPEDIPDMVRKEKFPPMKHIDFSIMTDNAEYMETIDEIRLMEYIAEARPDLAQAIQEMGMPGAKYIAKLRLHLLNLIKHPDRAMGKSTDYAAKKEMVKATCDKCGNSWAIPKDSPPPEECPFCHQ